MAAYQGEGDSLSYRAQISSVSSRHHHSPEELNPKPPNDSGGSANSNRNTPYVNFSRRNNNINNNIRNGNGNGRNNTQNNSYVLPTIPTSPMSPDGDTDSEKDKPAIPERSAARGNYFNPASKLTSMNGSTMHESASETGTVRKGWNRPRHDSSWRLLDETERNMPSISP